MLLANLLFQQVLITNVSHASLSFISHVQYILRYFILLIINLERRQSAILLSHQSDSKQPVMIANTYALKYSAKIAESDAKREVAVRVKVPQTPLKTIIYKCRIMSLMFATS